MLEALNQIVANSYAARACRGTEVSRTPWSVRTPEAGDSRGSRQGIPEDREGAGVGHGETMIVAEGEMIVGIVAAMNRSIGTKIGGETTAGDPRGIVTGTVRGVDEA